VPNWPGQTEHGCTRDDVSAIPACPAAPQVSIDAAGVQGVVEGLTEVGVNLNIGGSVHDSTDPVGRLLNVLGMISELSPT